MLASAGMNMFDAVTHADNTCTGGYSPAAISCDLLGKLNDHYLGNVAALRFAHYLAVTRGGWRSLINDPQVRLFLLLVAGLIILLSWHLTYWPTFGNAFRQSSFNAYRL